MTKVNNKEYERRYSAPIDPAAFEKAGETLRFGLLCAECYLAVWNLSNRVSAAIEMRKEYQRGSAAELYKKLLLDIPELL